MVNHYTSETPIGSLLAFGRSALDRENLGRKSLEWRGEAFVLLRKGPKDEVYSHEHRGIQKDWAKGAEGRRRGSW